MKTKFLAFIGILAILAAIVGSGYFFLGFYSVAATEAESDFVARSLVRVRLASIERHATERPPMSLDDAAVVRAGARAYAERGCMHCHGAPGVNWGKFSEGLRPDPPDLKKVVKEREPRHLFWVIKNGIKMTGMPGFALAEVPDQEIWTIVAFVMKLPTVSEADFKAWSAPAETR